MGFYRHGQWGLLALLDVTRVYRSSSSSGVITVSEVCYQRQSSTRGGTTLKWNAKAHDKWWHDVNATGLWQIQLNWSVLQLNCKFKLQIQFQIMPYAPLSLFTHFKMVKHRNKLHIHNPCIFLIIFHILYVKFGVKMSLLWILEVYTIFCNILNSFN